MKSRSCFMTFLLVVVVAYTWTWGTVCSQDFCFDADPCNRPRYCIENGIQVQVPDPDNCTIFWRCAAASAWISVPCSPGTFFSNRSCSCEANSNECQPPCPPYTGPSTVSTTIQPGRCPGNEDHICNATDVANHRKFPDISDCEFYFECLSSPNPPERLPCETGKVFDIDLEDCVLITAGFACEYRCHTTATTGFTTAITSQTTSGTTLTSSSLSSSFSQSSIDINLTAQTTTFRPVEETTTTQSTTSSTSSTSSSSSTSSTSTTGSTITTVSPNGGTNIGAIVGAVIGCVVACGIIVFIIFVKKKKKKALTVDIEERVDPTNDNDTQQQVNNNDVDDDDHGLLQTTLQTSSILNTTNNQLMAIVPNGDIMRHGTLAPILLPIPAVILPTVLPVQDFHKKAKKLKKKQLKPFTNIHPTRGEIISVTKAYKKSLKKTLKHRLQLEQQLENLEYDQLLGDLVDNETKINTSFAEEVRVGSWTDATHEISTVTSNYINSLNKERNKMTNIINKRDRQLQRKLNVTTSSSDQRSDGHNAHDQNCSPFVAQYLQDIDALQAQLLRDLTANVGSPELQYAVVTTHVMEKAERRDKYLEERKQYTDKLIDDNLTKDSKELVVNWKRKCKEVDHMFDYTPGYHNPESLHKMFINHMDALENSYKEFDSQLIRNIDIQTIQSSTIVEATGGNNSSNSIQDGDQQLGPDQLNAQDWTATTVLQRNTRQFSQDVGATEDLEQDQSIPVDQGTGEIVDLQTSDDRLEGQGGGQASATTITGATTITLATTTAAAAAATMPTRTVAVTTATTTTAGASAIAATANTMNNGIFEHASADTRQPRGSSVVLMERELNEEERTRQLLETYRRDQENLTAIRNRERRNINERLRSRLEAINTANR